MVHTEPGLISSGKEQVDLGDFLKMANEVNEQESSRTYAGTGGKAGLVSGAIVGGLANRLSKSPSSVGSLRRALSTSALWGVGGLLAGSAVDKQDPAEKVAADDFSTSQASSVNNSSQQATPAIKNKVETDRSFKPLKDKAPVSYVGTKSTATYAQVGVSKSREAMIKKAGEDIEISEFLQSLG